MGGFLQRAVEASCGNKIHKAVLVSRDAVHEEELSKSHEPELFPPLLLLLVELAALHTDLGGAHSLPVAYSLSHAK